MCVRCPGPLGSCSPVCPLRVSCSVCGDLATIWLPFTGVPARCVASCVRCPGPPGSCSLVCPPGLLCCVCGVLGHLAPVHRCTRSVRCFARAVSRATWLLLTGVPALCAVLRVRCARPLASCSPVCPLGVLCCVACLVSCPTWLLCTGVPAWFVVLRVRCSGPLGSCSPVRPLGALLCSCGVLSHLAPVHRCACSVCCVACAVSWATWLLFTGVPARCVVLRVRCPGPLGSYSLVYPSGVLCCVCGVLGHLAPVHPSPRLVCCVACAVSCATWLLLTGVPARCVVVPVRCPGPLGSCSPVCPFAVLCLACTVSWAPCLLFTSVPARCFVLRMRCPGPLGYCSTACPLGVLCCVCGVLGPWLLFTVVLARCAELGVRCPGPLGSCSTVCSLGVLRCGLRVQGVAAGRSLVHPDGGCS